MFAIIEINSFVFARARLLGPDPALVYLRSHSIHSSHVILAIFFSRMSSQIQAEQIGDLAKHEWTTSVNGNREY